ncbi:MAG: pseudouridine synthase, partial [Duncaniella sp.]|nr:pseudouridine synthase [Duncaniella sp.]
QPRPQAKPQHEGEPQTSPEGSVSATSAEGENAGGGGYQPRYNNNRYNNQGGYNNNRQGGYNNNRQGPNHHHRQDSHNQTDASN